MGNYGDIALYDIEQIEKAGLKWPDEPWNFFEDATTFFRVLNIHGRRIGVTHHCDYVTQYDGDSDDVTKYLDSISEFQIDKASFHY